MVESLIEYGWWINLNFAGMSLKCLKICRCELFFNTTTSNCENSELFNCAETGKKMTHKAVKLSFKVMTYLQDLFKIIPFPPFKTVTVSIACQHYLSSITRFAKLAKVLLIHNSK